MSKSLFQFKDLKNHTHRSGFDLSNKNAFTAKVGELLPVYWKFVIPGDKFTAQVQHFTRTQPVSTAAYTRIKEYYDWFFVPMRLLWKNFPTAITQMTDNPVSAMSLKQNADVTSKLPYFTLEQLFAPWANVGSVEQGVPSILTGLSTGYNPTSIVAQDKSRGNNFFGFSRAHLFGKLMSYLGYGRITDDYISTAINFKESTTAQQKGCYAKNFAVSPFPLLAYQKIYQDFFRRPEWESANPSAYNLDYVFASNGDTGRLNFLNAANILQDPKTTYFNQLGMFDLRYCNWQKDMIMGLLPKSQYGDVASVVSDGILNSSTAAVQGTIVQSSPALYSEKDKAFVNPSENVTIDGFQGNLLTKIDNNPLSYGSKLSSPHTHSFSLAASNVAQRFSASFDILQLREKQALQRWKEISLPDGHDYCEQIYKHFGVRPSNHLGYLSTYLGGSSSNIDINEEVNSTLDTPDAQPNIKGNGTGSNNSKEIHFESKGEYGILMCIYHAVPLLDYDYTGIDQTLLTTDANDYPIPEFDSIGMQSFSGSLISNDRYTLENRKSGGQITLPTDFVGYGSRYLPWKTSIDVVNGAFRTTMTHWVAPVTPDYLRDMFVGEDGRFLFNYSYPFLKVNPWILSAKSIFFVSPDSTVDTDCLLINSFFDVKAVRNLDYDGMPY